MTKLLERAFHEAAKLPAKAQDQLATRLLRELEDEARWDEAFAASESKLEELAQKALKEHRSGKTEELGFDQL